MLGPKIVSSSGNFLLICHGVWYKLQCSFSSLQDFPRQRNLHVHNLPNTSSYKKYENCPFPTVFSRSYLITANVMVTLMLTCGEGRKGENFIKVVIAVTLKSVTDIAGIQTEQFYLSGQCMPGFAGVL